MSFFGFDTALPEHRGQQQPQQQQQQQKQSRFATNDTTSFGHGFPAQQEEDDLATFTWGEGAATNLLEGGDEMNDETFGDDGDVGRDFQWSNQASAPAPKPKGPIASTKSRYGPKTVHDPFAASEDDFYSSRHEKPKKAAAPKAKPAPASASIRQQQPQAPVRQPQGPPSSSMSQPMWGAAPRSAVRPPPVPAGRSGGPPPMGQIKTLEEIEAEMTAMDFEDARGPAAPPSLPSQPQVRSLEEIEREMMGDNEPMSFKQPSREETPVQLGLAPSGYARQQALLDNMFPLPGQGQPQQMDQSPGFQGQGDQQDPGLYNEQRAREYHAKQERIAAKIQAMSTYNNCMGSSDKDFITRIQLSQLATADPYTSDFYAQVFTAVQKQRQRGPEDVDGPAVVKVGQDTGFGVGGASGNRFGQMGNKTMQKLSSQVKKLVEQRKNKQMSNDALQGALGRVSRTSVAAPKPVLAVPTAKTAIRMPQLNQQAGVHRQALTRNQALVAIEGLYDKVLELEQARMQMPPPDDIPQLESWNTACIAMGDEIWRRLMVMEPLDVSNPHPFVSLLNPIKGQKLFFRLQRHLQPQQAITLLTLLTATYSQLDVITRAPPPPVADASILSKVERKERAKREAETDNFLQFVVPGLDRIITEQCGLGLINGLFGICFQRMEVWRVASTRPGVALFTALLSKAQVLVRSGSDFTPADLDHWNKTFAYLLSVLLPHLPGLFPSSLAQKAAFGPGAYLVGNSVDRLNHDMERREAEVWGLAAALAVNAPDDEQTNLVGALRETILHTVQSARNSSTPPQQAEMKLRNVNMFLNGLGLDAAMIE